MVPEMPLCPAGPRYARKKAVIRPRFIEDGHQPERHHKTDGGSNDAGRTHKLARFFLGARGFIGMCLRLALAVDRP